MRSMDLQLFIVWLLLVFAALGCKDDTGQCGGGGEGCPCTEGGACDDGLQCFSNLCVNAGDGDSDSDSDSDSVGDTDADTDGDTVPQVNCSVVDQEAADDAIEALLDEERFVGCAETGQLREKSEECVALTDEQYARLEGLGYCDLWVTLSVEADFEEVYGEAVVAADGYYCPDESPCNWDVDSFGCTTADFIPWCVSGKCYTKPVCQCDSGEWYEGTLFCDGNEDCPDGSDEVGCDNLR